MHTSLIRHTILMAAAALLVVCSAQRIRAQEPISHSTAATASPETDEVTLLFHTISWGVARGQKARVSMVNPDEGPRVVFAQVLLFDAGGVVIAQSDEIAIPSGEFRSVDFDRDALLLAGEPGSGRIQTRAQVRYRSFFLVDRTQLVLPSPTVELIANNTGRSAAVWVTVGFFEVVQRPGSTM